MCKLKLGRRVYRFQSLASTQDWIKEMWKSNCLSEGDLCLADEQTIGRGRFERRWVSRKGGLYFSFVVRWPEGKLHRLGFYIPVGLIKTLSLFSDEINIKWPNDVYWRGRKLAGVLIESLDRDAFVCGIGLNVFNDVDTVGRPAVRLSEIYGETLPSLDKIFWLVLDGLNQVFEMDFDSVFEEYNKKLWAVPGMWQAIVNGQLVDLYIERIENSGRVVTDKGRFDYLEVVRIDDTDILNRSR